MQSDEDLGASIFSMQRGVFTSNFLGMLVSGLIVIVGSLVPSDADLTSVDFISSVLVEEEGVAVGRSASYPFTTPATLSHAAPRTPHTEITDPRHCLPTLTQLSQIRQVGVLHFISCRVLQCSDDDLPRRCDRHSFVARPHRSGLGPSVRPRELDTAASVGRRYTFTLQQWEALRGEFTVLHLVVLVFNKEKGCGVVLYFFLNKFNSARTSDKTACQHAC